MVGLPASLSGGEGPAAAKVRAFAARARAAGWRRCRSGSCDERLSTVTAEATLRERGKKGTEATRRGGPGRCRGHPAACPGHREEHGGSAGELVSTKTG